jgi:hypothetical protein
MIRVKKILSHQLLIAIRGEFCPPLGKTRADRHDGGLPGGQETSRCE